jgi:hyperosmotically inducible protein
MKNVNRLIMTSLLLALGANTAVHAQTASNAVATPQATSKVSKKQIRKMNWRTERSVRNAFSSTHNLDSSHITILVRSGKVFLEGTVPDESQIPLAMHVAERAEDGKAVTNNLTVQVLGN